MSAQAALLSLPLLASLAILLEESLTHQKESEEIK